MHIWKRIVQWFRDLIQAIQRKIIIPIMKAIVRYFSGKLEERISGIHNLADWKQKALEDFKFWLSDLPDIHEDTKSLTPDGIDLYTLLAEFTALRQEIKDRNDQQDSTLKGIENLAEKYEQSHAIFQERYKDIATLEERIRRSCEKKTAAPFLDVRDMLVRGGEKSKIVAAKKGLFTSVPRGFDQVVEGYETALRQFDRCLEMLDIRTIETVDRQFDPRSMKSVDKGSVPDKGNGIVLEERSAGFIRGNDILKMAEVVVNVVEQEPSV